MSTDPRTLADRLHWTGEGYGDCPHADDLRTAAALLRDLAAENDRLRAELDRRTDPDLAARLRHHFALSLIEAHDD